LEAGVKAFMGIPLLHNHVAIGVLYTMDTHQKTYASDDFDFMTSLARRATLAIINAQLFDGLRLANKQLSLQQAQLQTQVALLNEQNEELDAFSHTVAHDLNSPLALIKGYSELLEDSNSITQDKNLYEYAHIISRTSQRMSDIIYELLLLASVRKKDVQTKKFEMLPVVDNVLGRLEFVIHQAQALVRLPDSWLPAIGYAPWIEEIWANYISNAVKYGGQPPLIQLGSTVQADRMVRYWVKDNGRGLSPEEKVKIFRPFTQLSDDNKGHGLGLSIVQRIITKCNGRVGVESELGVGSTFWFDLPGADGEFSNQDGLHEADY
jgi:signal transduction histidine kinase